MIPGAFEYHRPDTVAEATGLLAELGDEARVMAGGHSLIPMMKLRMAAPEHLIDLQNLGELKGISIDGGTVSIGAMVTQADVLGDEALAEALPILREAAIQIADPQVRYMGTVGGNVANGDPSNDMPGLVQCLNATLEVAGPSGMRTIAARDFYEGAFATARKDEEILTRVMIPVPTAKGYAYEKQKRKIGDYATAAAAVLVGNGEASVAMTNLAETPIWSEGAGAALASGDTEGAVTAMLSDIEPLADLKGPVQFMMHAAAVILRRAIARAQSRA